MSVLIKGIHIDLNVIKVCGDCPFCYDYMYCLAINKTFCEHNIDCVDEKADWCPLVALPEHHGRLIDADALIDSIASAVPYFINDGASEAYTEGLCRAKIAIEDASTIIEAEGQDDE